MVDQRKNLFFRNTNISYINNMNTETVFYVMSLEASSSDSELLFLSCQRSGDNKDLFVCVCVCLYTMTWGSKQLRGGSK